MERQPSSSSQPHQNLIGGLVGLVKNMFGLLLNRIELAALEFSEVRTNLLKLALVFALGVLALWFALAYWTALLVLLAWDALGWKILLILAAVFSLLAAGIFWYARSMLGNGKLSMPATMAELRNDRDVVLGSEVANGK